MPIGKDEVTVIIPVLNEEKAIGLVLEDVKREGYENILVVDGHSDDATLRIAEEKGVKVIQQRGHGKTGAVKTAVEHVTTPRMLIMDGDYTYCAKDIERLLNHATRYTHVIGARSRTNMSLLHRLGNWVITHAFNLLLGTKLSDVCSGMYTLRTDVARGLELNSSGFGTEVELAAQTATEGNLTEVPISYGNRIGMRKLATWRHGFQILVSIVNLTWRYNPALLLSAIGGLCIIPASVILGWIGLDLLINGIFHSEWTLLGMLMLLLASQSLTVSVISVLLKRMERRIVWSLRESDV